MNQEKINYLRAYYGLEDEVTDSVISSELANSAGSHTYDWNKAKRDLWDAFSATRIGKCLERLVIKLASSLYQ
jgi:hypothetical protein